MGQRLRAPVQCRGLIEWHAEFRRLQAGGNVGVGLRIDIRVDAHGDGGLLASLAGDLVQQFQFAGGFHIEAIDVVLQRRAHFRARLADARKHHLARIAAGREHALQLSAGHDVEPGAKLSKQLEDRQVRVGLDGIADAGIAAGQRVAIAAVSGDKRAARVDVAGRAETFGDAGERDSFDAEFG